MTEELFHQATQNLNTYWGYPAFRPGQDDVVKSILSGRETLVLFPTGGGKSLCYQVPATVLPGLTLVISPLVALMQDQVSQLNERGIPAAFINSTLSRNEVEQRLINARNGMYKLLYCAPERLVTPLFHHEAPGLNIQLVAVDEAHCISEWGHDFRPPYRQIRDQIEEALGETRWMALTATATPEVRDDIIQSLRLKEPNIISKGFERKNLKWWVDVTGQKDTRLLQMVRKAPGAGLIYAGTRKACNDLAALIRSKGFKCEAYHAGLSSDERKRIQESWIDNTLPLVVATNAFGMGIDKPDCRYVIHYDLSYSLEAYYQEAGRAGRDGAESYPTLLARESDMRLARKRMADAYPDYDTLQKVYDALCDTLKLALGSDHPDAEPIAPGSIAKRTGLRQPVIQASLRILNRLGVLELTNIPNPVVALQFLAGKESLLNLLETIQNEAKKQFLEKLVRLYIPEALETLHQLDLDLVTARLEQNTNAVLKGLEVFRKEGVLHYEMRVDEPVVRLTEARSRKLPVTKDESERFRKIQLEKLEKMIGYIKTSGCRSAYIRRYFGESDVPDSCGFCDRCLSESMSACSTDASREQKQLNRITAALRQGPLGFDDICKKTSVPPEQARTLLRKLSSEKKVRYERKNALFALR